MNKNDYESVLKNMRLNNVYSIILDLDKKIENFDIKEDTKYR